MNTRAARLQQMGAALLELEILNSRAQDTAASSSSSSSPGKSQGRESGPPGREPWGLGTAGRGGASQKGRACSPGQQRDPGLGVTCRAGQEWEALPCRASVQRGAQCAPATAPRAHTAPHSRGHPRPPPELLDLPISARPTQALAGQVPSPVAAALAPAVHTDKQSGTQADGQTTTKNGSNQDTDVRDCPRMGPTRTSSCPRPWRPNRAEAWHGVITRAHRCPPTAQGPLGQAWTLLHSASPLAGGLPWAGGCP